MLRINCGTGHTDRYRAYQAVLDGHEHGEIKDGQSVEIDWCRRNIVEFEVTQDAVEIECGSNLRVVRILLGILYLTVLR